MQRSPNSQVILTMKLLVLATLVNDAKDELRSEIRTDGQINALIDTKITSFDQSLDRVTSSELTSATNSVKEELRGELLDSIEATTIVNAKITEFSGTLNYETGCRCNFS